MPCSFVLVSSDEMANFSFRNHQPSYFVTVLPALFVRITRI